MQNPSLVSPKYPHFFQPLLLGFKSHIKIPVKFFAKHIKGKHEGNIVNLRSDSSERTWKVKMEGHSLTHGWEKFVEAHDLRNGDFVIFRHQGDMSFHVSALGPSFCEIQYAPSRSHGKDEERDKIEESPSEEIKENLQEIKENAKTESDQLSSDLTCFSQSVTASNLSTDSVSMPIDFAKQNGLNKGKHEIVLMNEEGKSWGSIVKSRLSGQVFIVGGWTSFCTESKLEVGDSCTFKLLHNAKTPVLWLCNRPKAGTNRFVELSPTHSSLERGKQYLPVKFTRVNVLNQPGKIILVDKDKVEWSMKLKVDQRSGAMYIISRNGWKSFCAANQVGAGESLTLELIRGGTCPLLKFVSKQLPFEAEARPHKRARVQRWSKESRSKHDVRQRQKIAEEGGFSRRTRSSNKFTDDPAKLQHTQFCSISDHLAKVKQSVEDTLTSVRRFRVKLEAKEHNLEALLQKI